MSTQPMTFDHRWRRAVTEHGGSTFLLFQAEDGARTEWTYAEFDAAVDAVAATLAGHGVRSGTPVHLALRNCPAFVAVWLAAARLGAWVVPVDPASTGADIATQVRRTGPVVGIGARTRAAAYRQGAGPGLPVILLAEDASDLAPGAPLVAAGGGVPSIDVPRPHQRLAVMFTSGTTSVPKGVVLTQHNYAHVADTMSAVIALAPSDRWLVTLPLFHANAQYYCFAPAIAVGASVALTATFSASRWLTWAAELDATHASLFAAPIRMILARRPAQVPSLQLRHVWFAQSLAESHHREFAELVGCVPRQLYGMTETVAIASADMSVPPTADLIGDPADIGRLTRVVDPDSGAPVGAGTPGMLLVGGVRGEDLFLEYLDDAETTRLSFEHRGGHDWLRTSDLVMATPSGALRFVGRVDDVIKVAGENVSLTELEAAIARAPGVLEAAVLPRPDPIRDTVPVAYVVPRDPQSPPAEAELIAWAQEHLTPQSRPRAWSLIPELPRTSVGKIRRSVLQESLTAATAEQVAT